MEGCQVCQVKQTQLNRSKRHESKEGCHKYVSHDPPTKRSERNVIKAKRREILNGSNYGENKDDELVFSCFRDLKRSTSGEDEVLSGFINSINRAKSCTMSDNN